MFNIVNNRRYTAGYKQLNTAQDASKANRQASRVSKENPLATHRSAIKRHRQSLIRRARNRALKSRMKTAVKALHQAIEAKEKDAIEKQLSQTTSILAKTASKGIIHKNTAARKISRLTRRANAAVQANA